MNLQELKDQINELGVPSYYYSINSNLSANTYILNKVHDYWEFFYVDERGGRNDYRKFNNENDACIYMLEVLRKEMN